MRTNNNISRLFIFLAVIFASPVLYGQCILGSGTYTQSEVANCLDACSCTEIQIPSGAIVTMSGDWDLTTYGPIIFTIQGTGRFVMPGNGGNTSTLTLADGSILVIEDTSNTNALSGGTSNNNPRIVIGDTEYYSNDFNDLISNGGSPVVLLDFNVGVQGENIVVEWITASEIENDFFTIEISRDGRDWDTFAEVNGKGTSDRISTYSYERKNDLYHVVYYFRLSQTDYDGTTVYLATNRFTNILKNDLVFHSGRFVRLLSNNGRNRKVSLVKFNGKCVMDRRSYKNGELLDLSYLSSGLYVISFIDGARVRSEKLFIR